MANEASGGKDRCSDDFGGTVLDGWHQRLEFIVLGVGLSFGCLLHLPCKGALGVEHRQFGPGLPCRMAEGGAVGHFRIFSTWAIVPMDTNPREGSSTLADFWANVPIITFFCRHSWLPRAIFLRPSATGIITPGKSTMLRSARMGCCRHRPPYTHSVVVTVRYYRYEFELFSLSLLLSKSSILFVVSFRFASGSCHAAGLLFDIRKTEFLSAYFGLYLDCSRICWLLLLSMRACKGHVGVVLHVSTICHPSQMLVLAASHGEEGCFGPGLTYLLITSWS